MGKEEVKGDKGPSAEDVEARINDIMMEGGKVIKMEVDYSATVATKIPEAKALAQTNLTEALDQLLTLEKQTRTGADMHSTAKVRVFRRPEVENGTKSVKRTALFQSIFDTQ